MMLIYENIRLALFSLKANKMRALLTMLGIIIGIASVIAIMTVGNSLTASVTGTMSSLGASNITMGLQQKEQEEGDEGLNFGQDNNVRMPQEEDYFTKEMLEGFCNEYKEEVLAISASETVGNGKILDGKKYANISIAGVSLGYFLESDTTILAGRVFSDQEFEQNGRVAMISDYAVDNIFSGDMAKAIGSKIQVSVNNKSYDFIVSGVYEYSASVFGFSTTSKEETVTSLYIPLRTAREFNHSDGYPQFTIITNTGVDPDAFSIVAENYFDTYYRNNRFFEPSSFSMASIVEGMSSIMSTITTGIAVIAGIALLVGGIGVMNIMLVSITERTREIGTRKALGASNGSIRFQFIVEAIVLCLTGGIIGIILGVLLGIGMSEYLGTPAKPSLGSIILSLSFSMAIGVFFGYYPANKAAKMDPIEALRY